MEDARASRCEQGNDRARSLNACARACRQRETDPIGILDSPQCQASRRVIVVSSTVITAFLSRKKCYRYIYADTIRHCIIYAAGATGTSSDCHCHRAVQSLRIYITDRSLYLPARRACYRIVKTYLVLLLLLQT